MVIMSNEVPSSSSDSERWSLVAVRPASGTEPVHFEVIRPLTHEEEESTLRALRVMGWLTSGSKWGPFVEAVQIAAQQVSKGEALGAVTQANESFRSALIAMQGFALQVQELSEFSTDEDAIGRLKRASLDSKWDLMTNSLSRLSSQAVDLVQLNTITIKPGQSRRKVVLTVEAERVLGLPAAPEMLHQASEVLDALVERGSIVRAYMLNAVKNEAISSAKVLQLLASEVYLGRAQIMNGLSFGEPRSKSSSPTIRDLQQEHIQDTMLRVHHASSYVAENELALYLDDDEALGDPRGKDQSVADDQHSASVSAHGSSNGNVDDAEKQTDDERRSFPDEPDGRISDIAEEDAPLVQVAAIDFDGLYKHLISYGSRLEQKWSDALALTLSDADVDDEVSRWKSYMASVTASIELNQSDTPLGRFPLQPVDLQAVEPGTPQAAVLAQLYALVDLTETFADFTNPRLLQNIHSGRIRETWRSDGFSKLISKSDILLRAANEIWIANDGKSGVAPSRDYSGLVDLTNMLGRMLDTGAIDGAVIYAHLALSKLDENQLLDKAAGEASGFTILRTLIDDKAKSIMAGESSNVSGSWPLVHTAYSWLQKAAGRAGASKDTQ
jgi:hypothetical protein